MTDQGKLPGTGTFGKFKFVNNKAAGNDEVKWVPKGASSSLEVNPDPVDAGGGDGTWQNDPNNPPLVNPMNACDVYISATGSQNTWTKYPCTLGENYPYIKFADSDRGRHVYGRSSEAGAWVDGSIGTATPNTTPPS